MKEALRRGKERFGEINGVIHAAGIPGYQSIFKKEMASFHQVLAPKIKGTLVLEEVMKEEALDFICYFSSSSAILGDFGSCDYAIGNRFLMEFAQYGTHQCCQGRRLGKTLVINWPLWKDGGMGFGEDQTTRMYLKSSGQRFLEAEEGVALFERLLFQPKTQHLVLVGQPSRVNRFLAHTVGSIERGDTATENSGISISECKGARIPESLSKSNTRLSRSMGRGRRVEMKGLSLKQCVEWDLKEHTSQILKIPRDKLDLETNLADFGFDSISLAEFGKVLTAHYEFEITPVVFFGHSTIEKLTHYFLTEHQEAIQGFYEQAVIDQPVFHPNPVEVPFFKRQRLKRSRSSDKETPQRVPEPIAIIGMSGRFPQARDIEEMWKILSEGKDAVKEIPANRFDWRKYYGEPKKDSNKTNCKWSGCIPGVGEFDPLFFEVSPREAESMDPRQRHLLQESWKTLEDAGYGARQIKAHKIGMFVGVEEGDYQRLAKEGSVTSNHNGILAARLSYFLNLKGPTMAINTACSSSLVAAHQACLSLRNHECDTALAGGVNLMLTPEVYIGMAQARMLSSEGKCYAFDQRANGMVPGEAVAVVVLKRLSQAESDGDPIHAIIRGSGINYDGKTNGITAPSGVAQTELLKSVYEQARIDPEEIEYIVTHGTGTKLGDPVEINALYEAFRDATEKRGYCALTSTKSNFGHTFAASGLVSVISLVQALRHEMIPASLHCEEENDYIQWKESPFYVNKKSKAWPKRSSKERIGAISAFGMSGTNAHMVVQGYCSAEKSSIKELPRYLFPVSAKTPEALQERVRDIIDALQKEAVSRKGLAAISYTLQAGRHHFPYRSAIVVEDIEDAIHVWKAFQAGEKRPNVFQGTVAREFRGQKAIEQTVKDLLAQSQSLQKDPTKYQDVVYALADLYCQGYEIGWDLLYPEEKPQKFSLPTYPFAKKRYWINGISDFRFQISDLKNQLHPLVHENTSNFVEQRFSSRFTGEEFFLADHVVQGQKVLPGVAYLEMAREAVKQATGEFSKDSQRIWLKNVVWIRPIAVGADPQAVKIGLFPEATGEIAYEIYTHPQDAGDEPLLHSQGVATFVTPEQIPSLNHADLQTRLNEHRLNPDACYTAFKKMGIEYGPAHQGLQKIYVGDNEVLAKLTLPACVSGTKDQFILHPSLLDSALQALIGLYLKSEFDASLSAYSLQPTASPFLPFALDRLEVIDRCPESVWAWVRLVREAGIEDKPGANIQKLDMDLCDEQGNVCVKMRGFSSRVLEGEISDKPEAIGTLMVQPVWKEKSIDSTLSVHRLSGSPGLLVWIGSKKQRSAKAKPSYYCYGNWIRSTAIGAMLCCVCITSGRGYSKDPPRCAYRQCVDSSPGSCRKPEADFSGSIRAIKDSGFGESQGFGTNNRCCQRNFSGGYHR